MLVELELLFLVVMFIVSKIIHALNTVWLPSLRQELLMLRSGRHMVFGRSKHYDYIKFNCELDYYSNINSVCFRFVVNSTFLGYANLADKVYPWFYFDALVWRMLVILVYIGIQTLPLPVIYFILDCSGCIGQSLHLLWDVIVSCRKFSTDTLLTFIIASWV